MMSTKVEAERESIAEFQFISIKGPADAKNKETRRLVKSHAVKRALERKRKAQRELAENFLITTSRETPRRWSDRRTCMKSRAGVPISPSPGALDPFHTLPVCSTRLQRLLGDYRARLAPEPVFSVEETLEFQSFQSVFRTGLVDPALLNAVMLTPASATTDGRIDRECLEYKGQTISYIRERMSHPDEVTSAPTIGAILLLVGVEARIGTASQVQIHLNAVRLLLRISQSKNVYLTSGIKRAIFWQDLNSAILAGSDRIVDHTTFNELQWSRDPHSPSNFQLPLGFQALSPLLIEEFVEVLKDTHALQRIRDDNPLTKCSTNIMTEVNNHTASIQSRLLGLPRLCPMMEACYFATYLCSVMLCCKTWCALVIPAHISSRLLHSIQQIDESVRNPYPDLMTWMVYIGGAFAPKGTVRSSYAALLRSKNGRGFSNLYASWSDLREVLELFIWSETAFGSRVKIFWGETLP